MNGESGIGVISGSSRGPPNAVTACPKATASVLIDIVSLSWPLLPVLVTVSLILSWLVRLELLDLVGGK